MSALRIVKDGAPVLKKTAAPVKTITKRVKRLLDDMAETMYAAKGIGLAATQVDVHERVVVIDLSEEHNQLLALINPTITKKDGETTFEEGCLSVPGIYDTVSRAETVTVEYLDTDGKPQSLDADGLLAICIQHELDHLAGKLFVEYLSPLKQSRIKSKLKKRQRETL